MPAYAKKTCHGVKDYQSSDYSAFGLGARFLKKNNDEAETFLPFKKVVPAVEKLNHPFAWDVEREIAFVFHLSPSLSLVGTVPSRDCSTTFGYWAGLGAGLVFGCKPCATFVWSAQAFFAVFVVR